MKLSHLVLAFCIFFSSYHFLLSIWGPAGIEASKELETYELNLKANIAQLENIAQHYNSEIARLYNDASRLKEEAYRLGLISKNDIALRGKIELNVAHYSPGKVMTRVNKQADSNSLCLGISLCLGLLLLLLLNLFGSENHSNKRVRRHGMRIQTASLE